MKDLVGVRWLTWILLIGQASVVGNVLVELSPSHRALLTRQGDRIVYQNCGDRVFDANALTHGKEVLESCRSHVVASPRFQSVSASVESYFSSARALFRVPTPFTGEGILTKLLLESEIQARRAVKDLSPDPIEGSKYLEPLQAVEDRLLRAFNETSDKVISLEKSPIGLLALEALVPHFSNGHWVGRGFKTDCSRGWLKLSQGDLGEFKGQDEKSVFCVREIPWWAMSVEVLTREINLFRKTYLEPSEIQTPHPSAEKTFSEPTTSGAFGAIAVSFDGQAKFGASWRFPTQKSAEEAALRYCQTQGELCRALVWFQNSCASVAVRVDSHNEFYFFPHPTRQSAEAMALSLCEQHYRTRCKTVKTACSPFQG